MVAKKKAPAKKRAHKADGKFVADDPATPRVDEAYEHRCRFAVPRNGHKAVCECGATSGRRP